ncbi:DNA/RNA helicase, superfamily I [Leptolyngbya sp. PCC 7375]|nr:DNA/RNA helicase, superfamily I [Leptolyngbya sp. PCC 7375]
MLNYKEFVSNSHSLLIAPAGFGKTHTISKCLEFTSGKQLILTHTHAGVASIKEKIKKANIQSSCYNVETITSFAQKYVLAFYIGDDIPEQEDSKNYYPFIIEKATDLFKAKLIRDIIKNTYSGLFVDEYQDCSLEQHQLVLELSNLFPTRILGDHLQGIFGFNSEALVNLNAPEEMADFWHNQYALETPWRWEGKNRPLGQDLKRIRALLENHQPIELDRFSSLEVNIGDDIYRGTHYSKIFNIFNQENNLLILTPDSSRIDLRVNFIKRFKNVCFLMESIDEKSFYKLSKKLDDINQENIFSILREVSLELFNKTEFNKWFSDSGVKKRRIENFEVKIQPIKQKLETLRQQLSYSIVAKLLEDIKTLPGIKCYRKELFSSLCRVLEEAEEDNISVHKAMLNKRNTIRRMGRRVYGKCIGTTLLTKGLEFDAVLIVDAHKFTCPKNLYVAFTRASKRLIIFSNSKRLDSYISTTSAD